MSNAQEQPIDTRIVKTKYKNYDLLARYWNGKYRGRVWKGNQKIADYTGENIDLIVESLIQIVDQTRQNTFEERETNTLENEDFIKAWLSVIPLMDRGLLATLKMLARYKNHSAAMSRLLRVSGYETPADLLQEIQQADNRLRDELLLELYEIKPTVHPLCSLSPMTTDLPQRQQILVIDDCWADALLQADFELGARTA